MPTVHVSLSSPLPPADVLRIITDFGPGRSQAWPGVDDKHLKVHDTGPNWADVTEGNDTTWERERYDWDAAAGTISAVTSESNVWAVGSRWDYKLTPEGTGTKVDITLHRVGKGIKGKLIGAILPLAGKKVITGSFSGPLQVAKG
ncbi:MAG: SRPBCC family protein [Propionibacteriaceae bacterium]